MRGRFCGGAAGAAGFGAGVGVEGGDVSALRSGCDACRGLIIGRAGPPAAGIRCDDGKPGADGGGNGRRRSEGGGAAAAMRCDSGWLGIRGRI